MAGVTTVWQRVRARLAPSRATESPQPLVTVVVPVYNVAAFVAECLDSVLAQDHRDLQVVVIDDGSSDTSAEIVRRYAEADPRIEFHRQANAGLGATRNAAVGRARGEYLFFLDSDDRLPKRAISSMVAAAAQSGADVVMGPLLRFNTARRWLPSWAQELHRAAEFRRSIVERPELLRNHYACAKLYRRSFWTAQDARFREGVAYEDQPLVTRLLLAADGIACVADPVYEYRDREDGSSISQQTHTIEDLRDRATAWRLGVDVLASQPAPVRAAWVRTIVETHVHWYLDNDAIAEPGYWALLRQAVADVDRLGGSHTRLAPGRELALELLRAGDHERYLELRRRGAFSPERQRVAVVEDRFVWRPLLDDPAPGDPERPLEAGQLRSRVAFESARWAADRSVLLLGGRHAVPGLDPDGIEVRHELVATGPGGSATVAADGTDPRRTFAASLSWDEVSRVSSGSGAVTFTIRSRFGEAVVEQPLPRPAKWFAARRLPPALRAGLLLAPDLEAAVFSLTASRVTAWLDRVERAPGGTALVVTAPAGDAVELRVGPEHAVPVVDGSAVLPDAVLDRLTAPTRRVEVPLVVRSRGGVERPLIGQRVVNLRGGRIQLRPDDSGELVLVAHQRHAELRGYRFVADGLELDVAGFVAPGWRLTGLRLRSRVADRAASPVGNGVWRVDLAGLPEGGYDLVAEFGSEAGDRTARVAATQDYLDTVATSVDVAGLTWRALVAADGGVHFDAHPETADA